MAAVLAGCASPNQQVGSHAPPERAEYLECPARALVFTPPIALNQAPIPLWRDQRQASAFVGFDDISATFLYVRTEDRQADDGSERYIRRAVMEQAGARYR